MNFANYKISTRLAGGFGVILIFLITVGLFGINAVDTSNSALHQIGDINAKKIEYAEQMTKAVSVVTRVIRTVALLQDETEVNVQKQKIIAAREIYDSSLEKLEQLPLSSEGKSVLARIKDEAIAGRATNNKFVERSKSDHEGALAILMKESVPLMDTWQNSIEEFVQLQKKHNQEAEQAAFDANQRATSFIIIFSISALFLSILGGWFISNSIRKQLGGEPAEATAVALQIAQGDLTANVIVADSDTSSMMYAIKQMRDSLVTIVNDVRTGTDTIALASGEISAGNLDLSSRTEQQAASLEETASSMEELTATVKQNADNSRQANKLATNASEVAVKGGAVVAEVVSTMQSINESAKKIVDIIGVIDGIAFQTNILALNAAVEAARAGEQGRGFAVVASEVRNLAQRSASAAKEIKGLISDSVEKVDAGSRLVNAAGATMEEVVASVKRVNDIINEITSASNEQASGIDQINQAISQMDEVTQQNAALVEEAAAAAGSLQEQANHLVDVVRVFKIDQNTQPRAAAVRSAATPARKNTTVTKITTAVRSPIRAVAAVNRVPKAAVVGDGSWEEF